MRYDGIVQLPTNAEPISFSGTLTVRQDRIETALEPTSASEHTVPARFISANYGCDPAIISDVKVRKKVDTLVKYLKVINPAVTDITSDGNIVYADIGLPQMLPLNMLGNGVIRAASMLGPCILGNDRILLIDEIENGLHHRAIPALLKVLLRFSREQNMQIFATTHSRSIMESLHTVLADDECEPYRPGNRNYALQRDRDGLVRSYSYGYSDLGHALKHGIEIR